TKTANAAYKSNLTVLLESLSSKAFKNYSFYNDSFNTPSSSTARGDVSNEACKNCVGNATQDITTLCSSNRSAIIWHDYCLLRYANQTVVIPRIFFFFFF
ncbi:cysteine-rich receptor-like protein kinase 26, partial [Quercus suber]